MPTTTCLYLSNDALMRLESSGELALDGSRFTLKEDGRAYELRPAVRFRKVVSGADEAGLVGKVWSVPELMEHGAEHYSDSVLLGEVAYEVEEGFLGLPLGGAPPRPRAPAAEPSDGELIARLLSGQG